MQSHMCSSLPDKSLLKEAARYCSPPMAQKQVCHKHGTNPHQDSAIIYVLFSTRLVTRPTDRDGTLVLER